MNNKFENVAYYGGFFNPIHKDHIRIIKKLFYKYKFKKIFVVLSKNNHLKQQKFNISDYTRLKMLKIALKKFKFVKIITLEIENKKEFSFTFETLNQLTKQYYFYKFHIVVGQDHILNLEKWKNFNYLSKFKFLIIKRNNVDNINFKSINSNLKYKLLDLKLKNFNSSQIRNGQNILGLPKKILNFINKNNLYLKNRLNFYLQNDSIRILHCYLVANQALKIAFKYHLNNLKTQQLYLAAILHDITKNLSYQNHINLILGYKPKMKNEPKKTLHAYSGAALTKKLKYPQSVINAIYKHTCGAKKMNFFEKIIFVADKTSSDRNYENISYFRNLSFQDLNLAFKELLIRQYKFAQAKNKDIGFQIKKSYQYWIKK